MTVSEMMAILSDMPNDARVYFWVNEYDENGNMTEDMQCHSPILRFKCNDGVCETSVHFEHD